MKKVTNNNVKTTGKVKEIHQSLGYNEEAKKDKATVTLISGLNLLIAYAHTAGITNAAQMILSTKESIVYWAVEENFHESAEDRFINKHMMGNTLFSALDILTKHTPINEEMLLGHLMHALQISRQEGEHTT